MVKRYKLVFCWLSDDTDNEETGDDSEDEDEDEDDTEVKEENGVLVLTDANYDTFMEGKDTVLVEFYAPWYVWGSSGSSLCCCPCIFPPDSQNISMHLHYPFVLFEGAATANSLHPSMRK